jgi:hypothetical protein
VGSQVVDRREWPGAGDAELRVGVREDAIVLPMAGWSIAMGALML